MRVESREPRVESRRVDGLIPVDHSRAVGFIPTDCPARRGFTLTELLVVMVILVILTTMTVYAVNFTLAAERSRSAARQVQSYLEGARDRDIYESRVRGEDYPVGVRFLLDPNVVDAAGNPIAASSMVFIQEVTPAPTGSLTLAMGPTSTTTIATQTHGAVTWKNLRNRGLLIPGISMRIPNTDDGFWYVVQSLQDVPGATASDPPTTRIIFTPEFKGSLSGEHSYQLRLPPVVRPNQEPMLLPRGIVIDLDRSQVPSYWRQGSGYITQLDVMFSPRGTVIGRSAAGGLFHFYLAETADVDRLRNFPVTSPIATEAPHIPGDTIPLTQLPNEPASADNPLLAEPMGDRILVSLFPQTGAISSHPIYLDDVNANGVCDDPFRYAETGEVAAE